MKIQIRDAGTTSLRAVALTFFSRMSNQIYSFGIFFTESVLQIFVFLLVTGNGERNTKGGEKKKEALKEKSERDTDGGFLKRRAQVILHSELVMCFKDVFKGEDGLYDGVYCPSRKISPG